MCCQSLFIMFYPFQISVVSPFPTGSTYIKTMIDMYPFLITSTSIRKRHRFFKFWDKLTSRMRIKRRKRYLAEIIGNYALKARCFARIKLFIYNTGRVYFSLQYLFLAVYFVWSIILILCATWVYK